MGKILDFKIIIDKCTAGENVFGPGDTICGIVVVHLNEPTKIAKLEIDICGKTTLNTNLENVHDNAACEVSDDEKHDAENVKKNKEKTEKKRKKGTDNHLEEEVDECESEDEDEEAYNADEWHFRDNQVIWGKRGDTKKKMPIGRNEIRFEFDIPKGPLPTTFEGSMGFTRYWLEASLQPTRFEFDKKAKLAFTIASHPIDCDKYMDGITRSEPTSVLLFPCFPRRRKVVYSLTTDRGLYHPGDSILYSGEIRNNTKETATGQICLYQRVVYHNEESDTFEDRLVDCKAMNDVEGMETKTWTNSSFMIPPLPPSSSGRLINISYAIEMKLKIGDMKERTLSIPIQVSSTQVQTKSFGCSSYYCDCPIISTLFPVYYSFTKHQIQQSS